jgi:hypothetical protein
MVPWEVQVMKRPDHTPSKAAGQVGKCSDDTWTKKYPRILEYLTDDKYDDGSARDVSALSISIRDGDIALALNDKDLKCSLYTQAESLTTAMRLMEEALASGKGEWRPWNNKKRK